MDRVLCISSCQDILDSHEAPIPVRRMDEIDRWLDGAVVAPHALEPGDAEIVVLGELNHFVHEKVDFRLALAPRLLSLGFDAWAEELGWSDGARIDAYLKNRDEAAFGRVGLFGFRGDARSDRDDRQRGIFRASMEAYPSALMKAEHMRFLRGLKARAYFGVDVAAGHDGAYADLANGGVAITRVEGESIAEEIARLEAARSAAQLEPRDRAALDALIDGLRYTALVQDAQTYEATRPAMAFREDAMKRRFHDARALAGGRMVLMGHAMHLLKDDALTDAPGVVGPGGGRVSSLGHHIARECGLKVFAVWMIYGGGEDCQPLADLPRRAAFRRDTLNARLAARFDAPTLLLTEGAPDRDVMIGHMYNSVFRTRLTGQVDALYFIPRVTPLRAA